MPDETIEQINPDDVLLQGIVYLKDGQRAVLIQVNERPLEIVDAVKAASTLARAARDMAHQLMDRYAPTEVQRLKGKVLIDMEILDSEGADSQMIIKESETEEAKEGG